MSCDESPDCVCHKFFAPPTIHYHLINGNAPSIFYWFWVIGIICLAICFVVAVPRIIKIRKESLKIRHELDRALVPFSYTICLLIMAFPFIGAVTNFITLLAPITYVIVLFLMSVYQGLVLYSFTRLLIMHLGSFKTALIALSEDTTLPTKFYASTPLCCIRSCIKERRVNKSDFRTIYTMIRQYMFLAPFAVFLEFFVQNNSAVYANRTAENILSVVMIMTSVCCMYGTQCLLNASKQLLGKYNIVGKFKCIQYGVFAQSIPPAIVGLIPSQVWEINYVYNSHIMKNAWSAIISVVLFTSLQFGFRKYFNLETARNTMKTAQRHIYNQTIYRNDVVDDDDYDDDIGNEEETDKIIETGA